MKSFFTALLFRLFSLHLLLRVHVLSFSVYVLCGIIYTFIYICIYIRGVVVFVSLFFSLFVVYSVKCSANGNLCVCWLIFCIFFYVICCRRIIRHQCQCMLRMHKWRRYKQIMNMMPDETFSSSVQQCIFTLFFSFFFLLNSLALLPSYISFNMKTTPILILSSSAQSLACVRILVFVCSFFFLSFCSFFFFRYKTPNIIQDLLCALSFFLLSLRFNYILFVIALL